MPPAKPRIFHIVHVDRLAAIIEAGELWCDKKVVEQGAAGSTIGMHSIKQRRLTELTLNSHPGLFVGECVPFYFCSRSIMLYMMYMANSPEITYKGGQGSIIHMEADLLETVEWANKHNKRWAFSLSNAGSRYFEDRADLKNLNELNWAAIEANNWINCKEEKQAEFLLEQSFPWHLVRRIGVQNRTTYTQVNNIISEAAHRPALELQTGWYY